MTCRNCRTPLGSFSRKELLGPLCRPSTRDELIEAKATDKKDPRIAACNKRRQALDEKNGVTA